MNNDFKTKEDFKSFIEKFNIKSRNELNKRFYSVYRRFLMLDENIKEELLPSLVVPIILNTSEEYSNFVNEHNILTRNQFYKKFPNVYKRFIKSFSIEEQNKILPRLKNRYSINTDIYEYLEEYIKETNIKNRTEFSNVCNTLYKKFLKLPKDQQEKLLPSSKFSNIEDFKSFQKFIADNNVISRKDLDKRFGRLYVKFLKILTPEEQEKLLPSNREDLSHLNDYSGFLDFITKNNILSRRDFQKRSTAGYHKFKKILSIEEQDLLLPICHLSVGELFLIKLFNKNEFKFFTQKTFQDLLSKNNFPLRYDFYLPEYNILIEYHGPQHFDPNDKLYKEDSILRDKTKFNYAKSHGISILYFTNEIKIYKKFGYFTEVITDSDILIQEIKKIGLTNQSKS